MTSLRGRLLAAAFLLALFVIGVGAGPLMAILALAGLIVIAVIWIWPHAGLIGMILTGVGIPMLASSSTTIPVSITQILAMITLISYVHWAVLNRQQPTYAPHMWALIVFGGVVVISVFLAPDKAQSLIGASIYIRALLFAGDYRIFRNILAFGHHDRPRTDSGSDAEFDFGSGRIRGAWVSHPSR